MELTAVCSHLHLGIPTRDDGRGELFVGVEARSASRSREPAHSLGVGRTERFTSVAKGYRRGEDLLQLPDREGLRLEKAL